MLYSKTCLIKFYGAGGKMNVDFGYKHLTGLVWLFSLIAVMLLVFLFIKRRWKLGESFDRALIRYTCYFMWASDIIRSIRLINFDDFGPVGYYPLWMGPFHICSMALYAYLIIGSKHPGKLAKFVTPFGYSVMLVVTSIILAIPASSGILGSVENWSFCFDNLLPYQSWIYHGCLAFVPLYMALSGFYRPKWSDILRSTAVLFVVAACAQSLNFILDGSGADFMMLRYGNGNPFAFLLTDAPWLYYILLATVSIAGISLVTAVTIGARSLSEKIRAKKDAEIIEA